MAHDKEIEKEISLLYDAVDGLVPKRMFGGICYLYRGNMAFGIYKDNLIVRLGSNQDAAAHIQSEEALPFDITGREMKGWVMVPKSKLTKTGDYMQWLDKGLAFAKSLPEK